MNIGLKNHLNQALLKGIRFDSRKKDELRSISAETGVIGTAHGSARVKFGDTDVIAGVKLVLGTPFPDTPEDGVLIVNAELLPLSNPKFESGPPSIDSIEISRVIDRGLRECRIIDTKKLCVEPGEKVWMVSIDIVPINCDGNLMDAGGLAALLALKNAKMPEYKNGVVDYEKKTSKGIPITNGDPVPITLVKIGENIVADPLEREEEALDARLTVTTTKDGVVGSLQKGGDSPLTTEEIDKMIDLAIKKSKEIRKHIG